MPELRLQTAPSMPFSIVDIDTVQVSVPAILNDCFNYVLEEGLVEGIFRISGSVRRIRAVAEDYSQYKEWLFNEKKPLPHDVCGVIKKYLNQYLQTMNNLFSLLLLAQIRRLHMSHRRTTSDSSIDSFKSALTSLDSNTRVSVLDADADHLSFSKQLSQDMDNFIDAFAHLLVTRNPSAKNSFFVYLVWKLKHFASFEEQTKMSAENAAIIFQPYIFHTTNLVDLKFFQNLLVTLIENFDTFLEKFTCYRSLLDGFEELEVDNLSLSSTESNQVSPTTVYSSSSDTSKKQTDVETKRKSSISQKFGSFMDTYNSPANRSKRFSMNFYSTNRSSPDRSRSVDNFRPASPISRGGSASKNGDYIGKFPHSSLERLSIPKDVPYDAFRSSAQLSPLDTPRTSPKKTAQRRASKRKSFMGLFTSLSTQSLHKNGDNEIPSPLVSPVTPPADLYLGKSYMGLSAEKLSQEDDQNVGTRRMSRNLSLLRRK